MNQRHSAGGMPTSKAEVGKCPFDHSNLTASKPSLSEGPAQPVVAQPSSEAHSALNGCPMGYTASEPATGGSCPVDHGRKARPGSQMYEDAAAPAQCPMGFTAADGPRMTELHCIICKSLLYDCIQLSCSCKYCRQCVAHFKDCPLCGADITSRTPDTALQGGLLRNP